MDIIVARSIFTVVCLCVFVGIAVWAFSRRNKAQFEEAGRLRDEIRSLEATELGLPHQQHVAAPKGRATEGQPGTRKMRYGKTQRKFGK